MKKILLLVFCLIALVMVACSSGNNDRTPGQNIYWAAASQEAAGDYVSALSLYQQALPLLRQEGHKTLISDCRIGLKRTFLIVQDFSATEQDIRDTLTQTFTITEERINELISRIAYLDMGGARYYYSDSMDTVMHLDLALMQQVLAFIDRNRVGCMAVAPFVTIPEPVSGSPYLHPIAYETVATYQVPRNLLPATGVGADAAGRAEVFYRYLSSGTVLNKPLRVEIRVACDGKTKEAVVHVGLGLVFDELKSISQNYEKNLYAFSLNVKSGFHPDLNVVSYLFNAGQAAVWGKNSVGFKLYTEWVSRPEGSAHDDYYTGTANIVAGEDKSNFLVANQEPWYAPPQIKFRYPAVVMRSDGKHAYRINGRGAVLGKDGQMVAFLEEKMVRGDSLLFLSKDAPESWYQSLACSLNATSEDQYLMLEAVKLVPVYGAIADNATAVSGLVCGVMKGEYEKSLTELASWLGAQYLDKLMEPATFNKLTRRQQDAVLAAKGVTTGGTDNYKRKEELDSHR